MYLAFGDIRYINVFAKDAPLTTECPVSHCVLPLCLRIDVLIMYYVFILFSYSASQLQQCQ